MEINEIKEVRNIKNKKLIIIISITILSLIVVTSGIYLFFTKYYLPKQSYEDGLSEMEKHNYTLAIEAFEKSNGYSDAKEKIIEIQAIEKDNKIFSKLLSAYEECSSLNTIMSSDGLSISVDSDDKYDYDSLNDIKTIISELRLPDSLYDAMTHTNSLMGRQKETYGNYEVSWSYHPDNGLDAIFRIIE